MVWVQYTDVGGQVITVGPPAASDTAPEAWCLPDRTYGPGGDVDTLDTRLIDNEPDNPLNQLRDRNGERMLKQGVLVLSSPVGNPDDAARLGHDFLTESKAVSSAGQATLTGFVEDARTGMLQPYHQVRAGDDIEFVDAANTAARRIQHVDLERRLAHGHREPRRPSRHAQRIIGASRRHDSPAGPQLAHIVR